MPGVQKAWPEGEVLRPRPRLRLPRTRLPGPEVQLVDHARPVRAGGVRAPGARQEARQAADVGDHPDLQPPARGRRIPKTIPWDQVGDGSVYDAIEKAGKDPGTCSTDPTKVQRRVRQVHPVLGDQPHRLRGEVRQQEHRAGLPRRPPARWPGSPATTPAGTCRSRSSPTTRRCWTRSPTGAGRTACRPGDDAPVWRMDTFRDRFLTAYGEEPERGRVTRAVEVRATRAAARHGGPGSRSGGCQRRSKMP